MPTDKILIGREIVKSFSNGSVVTEVLRQVSIEVASGEFVSITGKSGSGKSTLLYQLGLLDTPDSGTIFVGDKNLGSLTESQKTRFRLKNFGFVFQAYALVPSLTAIENVIIPLLMRGDSKKEALIKSERALELVKMSDKARNKPSQLSGGQQQRVSIARAIAHGPMIIFADEPTANLDTSMSKSVIEAFKEIRASGTTIVLVTHDQDFSSLANRELVLSDGRFI